MSASDVILNGSEQAPAVMLGSLLQTERRFRHMNLTKIIAELRSELSALDDALLILERLARTRGKRRGRPPLYLVGSTDMAGPRKRRPFSKETRRKMAASQRRRWAAYRKAQKEAAT